MKILLLIGDHPRHIYLYKFLKKKNFNILGIVMEREDHIPPIPENLKKVDKINFKKHFIDRYKIETKYFGKLDKDLFLKKNLMLVKRKELNSRRVEHFIRKEKPDVCIVFGTMILKKKILEVLPYNTINLHLGLSPRYKGSATLFWPFYFLEPQYAGVTIHKVSNKVDSGGILHQILPKLSSEDGIHDVSCKLIKKACLDITKLLLLLRKKKWIYIKQANNGKLFLKKDFRVEHLRVIYNLFNNKIVNFFLKKKYRKYPTIISAFK
jgi:methionyl-tRNA formyltransferase